MYRHLTKLHLAGLVAAFGFAGRRLSVLVLSLAIVLALAGVTQAKKPEGTPGGPPNGDDGGPLKYSQFSAPLADAYGEIPNSLADIDNRGNWTLMTTDLDPNDYEICLDAFSGPGPKLLDSFTLVGPGGYNMNGRMLDGNGNWQAPSFQVRIDDKMDDPITCTGDIIQESGIEIPSSYASKFSAPFVALDSSGVIIGEVESTAQIYSSGYWILATSGLKRRQRYDICLFYLDPSGITQFLFLQDRRARVNGNLYGDGNAYDRYGPVTLQAPTFQIMEEPFDGAENCHVDFLVQESGIEILEVTAP